MSTVREHLDHNSLPYLTAHLRGCKAENFCPRCEGGGSYSALAPCTTFGTDCACNGPMVTIDPCPVCEGSGDWRDEPAVSVWDEPHMSVTLPLMPLAAERGVVPTNTKEENDA